MVLHSKLAGKNSKKMTSEIIFALHWCLFHPSCLPFSTAQHSAEIIFSLAKAAEPVPQEHSNPVPTMVPWPHLFFPAKSWVLALHHTAEIAIFIFVAHNLFLFLDPCQQIQEKCWTIQVLTQVTRGFSLYRCFLSICITWEFAQS